MNERNEWRRKMTTSPTNELGNPPYKEGLNGVDGKNQHEMNKLDVGLWKASQN